MRRWELNIVLMMALLPALLFGACGASIKKVARREGCAAAEEKLAYFAEREIRMRRFKDDLKLRLMLAPISFGLGFIANYMLNATYILPALAPDGFQIRGDEVGAYKLKKVLSATKLRGTTLDEIDDMA